MEIKPIPGTLGFLADSEGGIYDQDMVKRNTYANGDKYVTVNLEVIEFGLKKQITAGVHRLIAFAFHGEPVGEKNYVNHRDLNPANNRADNVEWVTPLQNNIHLKVMKKDNHRFCVVGERINRDANTRLTQGFMSVWDAEEKTGVPHLMVWDSIKDEKPVEGWRFSFKKYSGSIPKELQKEKIKERKVDDGKVPIRGVKFRNIDTGEVLEFESFIAAGKHFDTYPSHIHQAIPYRDVVRIFKKQYQVAYLDHDFQDITEADIEKARGHGKKQVAAWHHSREQLYLYESAAEFIAHSKLTRPVVFYALGKNNLRRLGDWTVVYYEEQNVSKMLDHVKGSSPDVV
jgi:hypothetical protein